MENGRCATDGGKSTGPPMKHGLRSKHVKRLKFIGKTFADALNDEQRVSSVENDALLESLIAEQLAKLKEDTVEDWRTAHVLFLKAVSLGGKDGADALRSLGELLKNGADQELIRQRLVDWTEAQGKHKDRMQKRDAMLLAQLDARKVIAITSRLLKAVQEEEKDRGTQIRIALRFADIMLSENLPGLDGELLDGAPALGG
jgi:hypothetical protein